MHLLWSPDLVLTAPVGLYESDPILFVLRNILKNKWYSVIVYISLQWFDNMTIYLDALGNMRAELELDALGQLKAMSYGARNSEYLYSYVNLPLGTRRCSDVESAL